MNTSVRVCHPGDSVVVCADMLRHDPSPVLAVRKRDGELVGLVTRRTVLAESWRERPGRIADIMTDTVAVCSPQTPVERAARLLVTAGTSVVFIESDGQLQGWVSATELGSATRLQNIPKFRRRLRKS